MTKPQNYLYFTGVFPCRNEPWGNTHGIVQPSIVIKLITFSACSISPIFFLSLHDWKKKGIATYYCRVSYQTCRGWSLWIIDSRIWTFIIFAALLGLWLMEAWHQFGQSVFIGLTVACQLSTGAGDVERQLTPNKMGEACLPVILVESLISCVV